MATLDALFRESVKDLFYRVLLETIAEKAAKAGITLSEDQVRYLSERLRFHPEGPISLDDGSGQDEPPVEIILLTEDFDTVQERMTSTITDAFPRLTDSLSDALLEAIESTWPEDSRTLDRQHRGFRRRLYRRWRDGLEQFRLLLSLARELGDSVNSTARDGEMVIRAPHLVEVLTRLHARACQIADEVLVLLTHGHADGAHARWRSIHELAVVAQLIRDGGEELAERYVAQDAVEAWKAAQEYSRCAIELGATPLTPAELEEFEAEAEEAMNQFGKSLNQPYGWAAAYLGKPRLGFETLERAVGNEYMRASYRMASHNIHANAKGIFLRIGLMYDEDIILAGPSDYGLSDPGTATATSLNVVSGLVATLAPTLDNAVLLKVMGTVLAKLGAAFAATENRLREEAGYRM